MERGPSCCLGAALIHAAPRQPTPGQGHPAEQVKKQEDVKSRAVCVGLLLKEMRGKYIRNIFVSEHEGKIYS